MREQQHADGQRGQRGQQRDRPPLPVLRLRRHLHGDRGRRRRQPGRPVVGEAAVLAGHQRRVRRLGRHHHEPGVADGDHLARLDRPLLGQLPALQPRGRRLLVRPPAHRLRRDHQPGLPGRHGGVGHVGVGVVRAAQHELAQRQPVHPAGVRTADHPHLGDAADVRVVHAEPDRAAETDHHALAQRADRHRQGRVDRPAGHPDVRAGRRPAPERGRRPAGLDRTRPRAPRARPAARAPPPRRCCPSPRPAPRRRSGRCARRPRSAGRPPASPPRQRVGEPGQTRFFAVHSRQSRPQG